MTRRPRLLAALTAALAAAAAPGQLPLATEFHAHVERIIASYPTDGTHRYHWPKRGSWPGVTRDLHYRGELVARGDPQRRCYCCGLTFEVFWRAWEDWCTRSGRPFLIPALPDRDAIDRLRRQWFGADGNQQTLLNAIVSHGLGHRVARLDDARPGDFVQFWRRSGSGHSAVFVAWRRKADRIVGIEYWSTQKSTDGIGRRVETFDGERGVDPSRVYIARVGAPRPDGDALGVVAFNIRRGLSDDGDDRWENRRELVFDTIAKHDPDVLGLQEALPTQTSELRRRLRGYELVDGDADRAVFANISPLMVRRARLEVERQGHFWLSETPERALSKSWDARWPRTATWALVRDKRRDGRRLLIVNTHLDNVGPRARTEGARMIVEHLAEFAAMPRILTGDLNARIESEPLEVLFAAGLRDSYGVLYPDAEDKRTVHNFRGYWQGGHKIDYVLCDPSLEVLQAGIDRSGRDGRFPSDHFPVWAVVR